MLTCLENYFFYIFCKNRKLYLRKYFNISNKKFIKKEVGFEILVLVCKGKIYKDDNWIFLRRIYVRGK